MVLLCGRSIPPTIYLKHIQAFLRALKSAPYNCVLVLCRVLKSLIVNKCWVNSYTLLRGF